MVCLDDVCTDATVVEPGGLGDPCNDENPCGTDNGTQLECADGTCALPVNCPEGTAGCACLAGDTCADDLICTGGVCFEPTCTAGTLNCPCDTGNVCSGELSCDEGVCKEPVVTISAGLSVSNPDVRSCQLIIELDDIEATFDASVQGRTKRDGGRLAVAFSSTSDVGPTTVATFTPATNLSSDALSNVTCYDRLGQPVDSPGVALSN